MTNSKTTMKTKFLFLFLLFLSVCTLGQGVSDSSVVQNSGRKNVVKFLPMNLVFNSLSFEYERKFSPKSSFILGVGIPRSTSFAGKFTDNSGENKIYNDAFSTMSFRAAYRHYSGHRIQPSGFYFSPYLKYQSFTANADNHTSATYGEPPVTAQYVEKYDVSGNTLNFGIQWGVQFLIAKLVTIDFYFLGIEAGLANVTATVTSPNPEMINSVESDVRKNVSELPSFFSEKIEVTRRGTDQVEVKGSSMPYPWLRSGISIGIAF
jgi:hypothetical protein